MIVRQDGITFQSAHAQLAARLVAPLERSFPDLWWGDLNLATLHHDHGWIPYDLSAPVKDGKLLNFLNIELDEALTVCQGSIDIAYTLSSACGVLVSKHMEYLYGAKPHRGLQEASKTWAARRARTMTTLGLDEEWLSIHYEKVMWADTLSLLLICEPSGFTRSLRLTLDGQSQELIQLDRDTYSLKPWLYSKPSLNLRFEVHSIPETPQDQWSKLLGQGIPKLRHIVLQE